MRRVAFELGIHSLRPSDLVHMGRLHYHAQYTPELAEFEVDHILFARVSAATLAYEPNPDEVQDCMWVTADELRTRLRDDPETVSPWCRLMGDRLFAWWDRFAKDSTERPDPRIVYAHIDNDDV